MHDDWSIDAAARRLEVSRGRFRLVRGVVVPGTRYRIESWAGDGATGTVYEASHTELDRRVAIKVLHEELSADPEKLSTFRGEAKTTSQLGSANIVEVYDFVALPDGRLAYVMELLRGRTMEQEIQHAPIEGARLIAILRQACRGLAVAHDAGVVHRDVKPENMFLVDDPERPDRLKIMDFGIASVRGTRGGAEGTPAYMAPEMIRGQDLQPTVDIYALGCTAYELVAGTPPFVSESVKDVLRGHLRDAPVPLSEAAAGALPPALADVVMRCLAKDEQQRYRDMRDLEAALCEAQIEAKLRTAWDDLPLPEVEPARRARLEAGMPAPGRAAGRRPWLIPAIGGAAAATLGFTVWAVAFAGGKPELGEVERLAEEARDAAARARFVYPPAQEPESATAYGKVVQLEGLDGGDGDDVAGTLREEFAETLVYLGDRYWAEDGGRPFAVDYYVQALLFDPAHPTARERGAMTPGQLQGLTQRAASGGFSSGELRAAEPLAVLAIDDEGQRDAKLSELAMREPTSMMAAAQLDHYLTRRGKSTPKRRRKPDEDAASPTPQSEPTEPAPEAATLDAGEPPAEDAGEDPAPAGPDAAPAPAAPKGRDPAAAKKVAAQGHDALASGQWKNAEKLFHQAVALDRRCPEALIGLSDVHFERGEYQRAITYGERAIAQRGSASGYRIRLGDAYYKVLRYDEARAQYEKALTLGNAKAARRIERLDDKVGG